MAADKKYAADAEEIISRRYDNGGDLWATSDKWLLARCSQTCQAFLLQKGREK